jgi:hypothetical protein
LLSSSRRSIISLDALHLLLDLAGEQRAVGFRQVVLQQLGGAADRRHRALQLMRQGAHIALAPVAPFEAGAHRFHGLRQLAQFARQPGGRPSFRRRCTFRA